MTAHPDEAAPETGAPGLAALRTRVRAALGRSGPVAPVPRAGLDECRLVHAGGDLPARFASAARSAGMRVREATQAELASALGAVLEAHAVRRAGVAIDDAGFRAVAHAALTARGIAFRDPGSSPGLDDLYDLDAGITDAHAAVAETGSLVLHSSQACGRGTFLVPPVHIAILDAQHILPDLLDLWPGPSDPMPASVVLVSGPSKTADIEGVLVTGVHGPRIVEIVLVR